MFSICGLPILEMPLPIAPNKTTVMYGRPKAGKTAAARDALRAARRAAAEQARRELETGRETDRA